MKKIKKILLILAILCVLGCLTILSINFYVKQISSEYIIDIDNSTNLEGIDYILILGAGINADGTPSPMLKERLDTGIELYKKGVADKIIVSGDHLKEDHDEVNTMKNYMATNGVPSDSIYMDHAGISTYDSLYRAKNFYSAKNLLIVTQEYHLYRSLYIGKKLGLEAHGVSATKTIYNGQIYRDFREFLARIKDYAKCLIAPASQVTGTAIPVSKGGNATNDKDYIVIKNCRQTEDEKYINAYFILEKVKDILKRNEFQVSQKTHEIDYALKTSLNEEYGIIYTENAIVLTKGNMEASLNDEDSETIKDIISSF